MKLIDSTKKIGGSNSAIIGSKSSERPRMNILGARRIEIIWFSMIGSISMIINEQINPIIF